MNLKKPKFWDYQKPNIIAYLLLPITFLVKAYSAFVKTSNPKKFEIKTICVGNFYIGGTGKTSLSIKINEILTKEKIKSCFIKKFYKDQKDEQKLLEKKGKLFLSTSRVDAINEAEKENYEVAILDDGLQDKSINYDTSFVCFNNINWIGNGMTIPSGPLRENIKNLKFYDHVFLNGNLENIENLKEIIYEINSKIIIHIGIYEPINLNEFKKDNKYLVFSGIGNHKTFVSMLKNNGLKILKDLEFPDHYEYNHKDLNKILNKAKDLNCEIITTEKDYFRIENKNIKKIKYIKSNLRIVDEKKLIKSII